METALKRLAFIIIFIAVPAFAALDVSLVDNGDGTISIMYSGADANEPNKMPRAFALDITIDSPGEFTDVSGYKNDWVHDNNGPDETGESNSSYPGFGIYPARISWWLPPGEDGCDVNSWGNPLADDTNDLGAGEGLGSGHIVLEFGSLYYGDANRPLSAGTLCKLEINCNSAAGNLNIHMVDEDTYRGGLVYEDSSLGEVNDILVYSCGCEQPVPPTTPTPANGTVGVSVFPTKPTLCWLPAAGGDNPRYDVYFGTETTPPIVSADQTATCYLATGAVQGKAYYWKIVAKNDCNSTGVSGPIWSFNTDCYKSTAPDYAVWAQMGKPDCWCYQRHCRGDYNGVKVGVQWVSAPDLNSLVACYGKNLTWLTQNPQYLCADFNHAKVGVQRIAALDLNILMTYYGKNSTVVTPCTENSGNMNFWTN